MFEMKALLLACLITVVISFPYAGKIDLGQTTKNMAGTNDETQIQALALWFSKGDVDGNGILTHQELFAILSAYSGHDISTCHLTAALIIQTGDVNGDRQLDALELMRTFDEFSATSKRL